MVQGETNVSGMTLDFVNGTGNTVPGGTVLQLSGKAAITVSDVLDTETVAASIVGIHKIQKKNIALADEEKVFWDEDGDPEGGTAGDGALTNVAADGDFEVGIVIGAVIGADERARVLLNGFLEENLTNVIADPGDGNAIPVTKSGSVPIVTVGAETRTLAIPSFVGQQIMLTLKTDGGDAVVTIASAINFAGNNTLTFAEVSDSILLVAIDNNGVLAWRISLNEIVALTTV